MEIENTKQNPDFFDFKKEKFEDNVFITMFDTVKQRS
jgi:hypothetical protein